MKRSNFNRQIAVLQKQVSRDAYGGEVVSWVPLVALPGSPVLPERWRAEVQDVLPSKSESIDHAMAMGAGMARIRMRYRTDIDGTMRIVVYGDVDKTFDIVSGPVEIGGRKDRIEMMCQRFTTQVDVG